MLGLMEVKLLLFLIKFLNILHALPVVLLGHLFFRVSEVRILAFTLTTSPHFLHARVRLGTVDFLNKLLGLLSHLPVADFGEIWLVVFILFFLVFLGGLVGWQVAEI